MVVVEDCDQDGTIAHCRKDIIAGRYVIVRRIEACQYIRTIQTRRGEIIFDVLTVVENVDLHFAGVADVKFAAKDCIRAQDAISHAAVGNVQLVTKSNSVYVFRVEILNSHILFIVGDAGHGIIIYPRRFQIAMIRRCHL